MNRKNLKYRVLALMENILSVTPTESLWDMVDALECGDGIDLKPKRPMDVDNRLIVANARKMMDALKTSYPTIRPKSSIRRTRPKVPEIRQDDKNIFNIPVKISVDIGGLNKVQKITLLQNLDKMICVEFGSVKRTEKSISGQCKIGVPLSYIWPEQKTIVQAFMQTPEYFTGEHRAHDVCDGDTLTVLNHGRIPKGGGYIKTSPTIKSVMLSVVGLPIIVRFDRYIMAQKLLMGILP